MRSFWALETLSSNVKAFIKWYIDPIIPNFDGSSNGDYQYLFYFLAFSVSISFLIFIIKKIRMVFL